MMVNLAVFHQLLSECVTIDGKNGEKDTITSFH